MWGKTVSIHSVLREKNLYLLVIVILNQLIIKKNKIDKDNFKKKHNKKEKNHVGKNIVAIHSNLLGKLQCFPHIL